MIPRQLTVFERDRFTNQPDFSIAMPAAVNLPTFTELERFGRSLEKHDALPLLITGIAGVGGYNAFAFFRAKYGSQVTGQRPVRNWPLSGEGIVGCDLENTESIERLLKEGGFKTVLNCGGSCALKSCELDPQMAQRVNVTGVNSLLTAMESTDARFVHLSIDLVFSGSHGGNLTESDPVDPVSVYGKTMVQAEEAILSRRPASCILRISLPMGISFNGHAGAIDWIQARFAAGKPATLYYDEIRTPTYVECLIEVIEEVLCGDATGVFHAGGTRKLSLYQIAQVVNRVGGYPPELLHGCYRIEAGPIPPRAGNVTMISDKLRGLVARQPFVAWPMIENQVPTSRTWHYDRPETSFTGSAAFLASTLYDRPSFDGN